MSGEGATSVVGDSDPGGSALAPGTARALVRGVLRQCPRCGQGRLFKRCYTLYAHCRSCGLEFETQEGNTWAFMYLSTAFLTGWFVVAMLIVRPSSLVVGRVVLAPAAVLVIVCSLPIRKGIAVALDYLISRRTDGDVDSSCDGR